jgi:hypothetical protein
MPMPNFGSRPLHDVVEGARHYQQQFGIGNANVTQFGHVAMPGAGTSRIADAYAKLPDFDHGAVPAYHAMREEVMRQFDHMTRSQSEGGMGIGVQVTKGDPYGLGGVNPVHNLVNELRDDVQNHHQIKVLATQSTGGHPLFTNDQNDAFRAVHDVFGHLGSGRGIDRHGEEAAFQKHAQMFSPLARMAMATETRGQNAALHATGSFQDQKVALLPASMRSLHFMHGAITARDRFEAHDENRKQGLL